MKYFLFVEVVGEFGQMKYSMKEFNWGNIHRMSSCVKQVWLVMLINFCLLHLWCLGSLHWLGATVSSERATSSLSGAGGNLLHTSNWTKCLSNSEPSYTDHIIIQTRCQQRFFTSLFPSCSPPRIFWSDSSCTVSLLKTPPPLAACWLEAWWAFARQINYKKVVFYCMAQTEKPSNKRHFLNPQN